MKQPDASKNDQKLVGAVLLAIAALIGYFGIRQMDQKEIVVGTQAGSSRVYNTPDDKYERRVNEHLRAVDMKMELERSTLEVENSLKAPSLNHAEKEYSMYFENYGVSLDQEGRELKVHEDLRPHDINPTYADTPHDDVQARLQLEQQRAQAEKLRIAQLKAQAKAQARAEGYDIEINDAGVVTEVKKLSDSASGGIQ